MSPVYRAKKLGGVARWSERAPTVYPGRRGFTYHLHHVEEEWMFVISGRGAGEVGEEVLQIGPGDFLGFPPGGAAHHVRNTGTEDLVYLSGGENREIEVGDFPRLGLRMVRFGGLGGAAAVYRMDAEVPFAPPAGGGQP